MRNGKAIRVGQQNTRVEIGEVCDKTTHVVPKRTSRQSHVPQCNSSNVRFPHSEGPPFYIHTPPVLHTVHPHGRSNPESPESLRATLQQGLFFLKEKASVAKHVHAGVEDLSVGGAADTGDEGRQFVEETDGPASWVVVC